MFLSHIGSFVPADAAVVGLTDRCDSDDLCGLQDTGFCGYMAC